MLKLFKILIKKWYLLIILTVAIITQVWFQLNLPEYMGNIQTIITYIGNSPVIDVSFTNPLTGQLTVIASALSQDEAISLILNQGGWMILTCVIVLVCAYIQFYCASTIGAYTGKELRRMLYTKVNSLSLAEYSKFDTATLITRTTNDTEQIKNYMIMALRTFVMSPTYMIIAIIKTCALDDPGPTLTSILAISIPLIIAGIVVLFIFVIPLFQQMQYKLDAVTVVFREGLTGIRVIRAYNQQETESKKFHKVNLDLKNINVKASRIMSFANPAVTIIFNFSFVAIYALGFYLLTEIPLTSDMSVIVAEQVTVISVVAQYSMQIMNSFLMFAMILIMIPQASASYKRIQEVLTIETTINDSKAREYAKEEYEAHLQRLEFRFKEEYKASHNGQEFSYSLLKSKYEKMNEEEKVKDPQYQDFLSYINIRKDRASYLAAIDDPNADTLNEYLEKNFYKLPVHGEIEFKNVSFTYPDANTPTIKDISFKTKPGTTTAIIGSTGSGKSTVINLIPRFYDTTEGQIIFDGVDIRNLPQKVLRNHIGFVPQTALLFTGTIRDNMKYGKSDATDVEINTALEVAQAKKFVEKLPNGLDTEVSQGGKNFSGGQKQRLCIARTLVRKPEIYIFDDSFSALDFKTDAMLRAQLKNYTQDASVIIVAQRVSSILDADNIIVLHDGKCVGQGKHIDLLKTCPVYQDIVKSQLDPEEVEKTIKMSQEFVAEGGNN